MSRSVLVSAILLVASSAARGEETGVRQLVGIGVSGSDSGAGIAAQLGIRIGAMLLRGMLDLGGGTGKRGYAALAARADWVQPLSPDLALTAGLGIGKILYGFILDSPTANVGFLGPEAGVLIGKDRALGRILIGLRGFVPIEAVPHPRDFAGQAVLPPHVMATVLLSL